MTRIIKHAAGLAVSGGSVNSRRRPDSESFDSWHRRDLASNVGGYARVARYCLLVMWNYFLSKASA